MFARDATGKFTWDFKVEYDWSQYELISRKRATESRHEAAALVDAQPYECHFQCAAQPVSNMDFSCGWSWLGPDWIGLDWFVLVCFGLVWLFCAELMRFLMWRTWPHLHLPLMRQRWIMCRTWMGCCDTWRRPGRTVSTPWARMCCTIPSHSPSKPSLSSRNSKTFSPTRKWSSKPNSNTNETTDPGTTPRPQSQLPQLLDPLQVPFLKPANWTICIVCSRFVLQFGHVGLFIAGACLEVGPSSLDALAVGPLGLAILWKEPFGHTSWLWESQIQESSSPNRRLGLRSRSGQSWVGLCGTRPRRRAIHV